MNNGAYLGFEFNDAFVLNKSSTSPASRASACSVEGLPGEPIKTPLFRG
jgi:hypothetical protein